MAGSLNKVMLIGNLGRDPEVRNTNSGMKIVQLNLATSESWKDRNTGERQEKTEWHRVVIMNDNLADIAERYLKKGSKVFVQGTLQTRKWTDKDGVEKYTTEVMLGRVGAEMVLLDSRGGEGGGDYGGGAGRSGGYGGEERAPARSGGGGGASAPKKGWDSGKDLDDDIPF
jgi:single-strand DNA-binding protein